MKFYDEDQKKIRYKFGFYSLLIMTALLLVFISMPDDRFGEISYQNAIMVIIMISALFFLVMAGLQAQQAYQLYQLGMDLPNPINTVGFLIVHGLQVALHLSIPLTYGVRTFVDWLSAKEQNA